MTAQKLIRDEMAAGVPVPSIPGLVLSREAASPQPAGEWVDGRSSAIKAVLRELRKDGVKDGTPILIQRASESGVTVGFPSATACADGSAYSDYHQFRVNPRNGEITSSSACGEAPAAEL